VVAPESKIASGTEKGTRPVRPTLLTQRGAEALIRIERLMEDANRALIEAGKAVSELPAEPSGPHSPAGAFASATGSAPAGTVRGN
jgi:hypothetical protein